jgi:cell division protein FtsB
MENYREMTDDELSTAFDVTVTQIDKLQQQQKAIDKERRRRYAESQIGLVAQKEAELAALKKSLEV